MALGHLAGRAAAALASGIAGAVIVDGIRSGAAGRPLRGSAVAVTAWGLRARRSAETGAERVRLATGDIVAQARERVGEQAPPPTVGGTHGDHEH